MVRAGRAAAAAGRGVVRLRHVVRHDDAPRAVPVRRPGREPSPRRRVGTDGPGRRLAEDRAPSTGCPPTSSPTGGQLLLVVDQFEELFTSATERGPTGLSRTAWCRPCRARQPAPGGGDAAGRLLRPPARRAGLRRPVNDATVTIAAMTPTELEAAIVEPAERVGRRVERALVAELVSAVADEPAALPALQFTLYELAEACTRPSRSPPTTTLGRVDGAIAVGPNAVPVAGRRGAGRGPAAVRAPRRGRRRR